MQNTFKLWEILKDIAHFKGQIFEIQLPGDWDKCTVSVGCSASNFEDDYYFIAWVKRPEGVISLHELPLCGAAIEAEYKLI